MWNEGVDNNPGATPETGLSYGLQIATVTTFASLVYQGDVTPPKTYDGGTKYGKILTTTSPWCPGGVNYGLRTDTTYYHRVQTIDGGLARSAYTLITVATSTLWTGVGPATSTLAAAPAILAGDIRLGWNAPGDDAAYNNLTGSYRVQYASSSSVSWSTATTPAGAFTLTVATTNVVPGTAQSLLVNVPTNDTWYFVLWSRDDVGEWSLISNTTGTTPAVINRSVTIDSGARYDFGSQTVGTSSASTVAIVLRNDGNIATPYSLLATTTTVGGSPWAIGSTAGSDTLAVFGAFHGVRPLVANFGPEDVMSPLSVPSDATVFSINGTQTGAAVAAGGTRNLWLRLDTPTLSSTETQQQITVTITAGP